MASTSPDLSGARPVAQSSMTFLQRSDRWLAEKPYRMRYIAAGEVPPTNFLLDSHEVDVCDMRPYVPSLSLDVNGFEVHKIGTSMSREDFSDYYKVTSTYMKELSALVAKVCGAKRVHPLDYELRKRHETFPISTGKKYDHGQPSLITHIDVTAKAVGDIVREIFGEAADEILASRVQCVTAWKPLRGPVEDWPLALCDARTLDVAGDVVDADAVYRKFVAENRMIHHNPHQRWFYLANQQPDEVLLFKAADSDERRSAPVAHGSFHLPRAAPGTPRESIDVRMLVMHADIEYPEPTPWHT